MTAIRSPATYSRSPTGSTCSSHKLRITVLTDYKGGFILFNSSAVLLHELPDVVFGKPEVDAAVGSGASWPLQREEPQHVARLTWKMEPSGSFERSRPR